MKTKNFLHIIALLIYFSSHSQVNFITELSKNQLGINERLKVEFKIDKDGDNFVPPNFENFKVVGGPSQSIQNSWINGVVSYSKSYSYFLSPIKKGSFEIGQASIEVDGKIYKTIPVKVTVTSAIEKPKNPNDPNFIADKNVHLVAEISNKNPFINEAVLVTYKLYVSQDTGVDNWSEIESPRYVNFWSKDFDIKSFNTQNGTYNGKQYRYATIKKILLYPQKTGKLKIEPITLDLSVRVPSNRVDPFFGGRVSRSVIKRVSAGSFDLEVKSLPLNDKPEDFTGAVGDFNFEIKSNKDELLLNESFQLNMIISGNGNLNLFDDPLVDFPNSFEVYEPEKTSNISSKSNGLNGAISKKFTIVPSSAGQFTISNSKFSFFNPKTRKFKTIYADPVYINVIGNYNDFNDSSKSAENKTNKVQMSQNQFSSFKTTTKLSEIDKQIFFNSQLYWFLFFVPFSLCLIIVLIHFLIKKYKSKKIDKRKVAKKLSYKLLDESKNLIGDKLKFYETIDRALITCLKSKINLNNSELNDKYILEKLSEEGVDKSSIDLLLEVLKNCKLARYTPLNIDAMSEDYEKAKLFMNKLENF